MIPKPNTIGLVPPRYGPEVIGGAEAVIAELAAGLAERGWSVEILTTCARDHVTWANEYEPGITVETHGGAEVVVRRFPTVTDTKGKHRQVIGNRILMGEHVSIADQQLWVNDSLRVPELWHYVSDNAASYRALVFAPYMFWTTFAVGQIVGDRSIIMPCLHDELPARLELFQPMISGARGLWFLSEPEAELAASIFSLPKRHAVVGAGIDIPSSYDESGFRRRHQIQGRYLYYAGRREWGKGWLDLVAAFESYCLGGGTELTLVTSGAGDPEIPESLAGRVVDVGFLSTEDRNGAMAGAEAYIQPSALESFSRTVLEAWLAGTPVIANAGSAVVSWHVERSGAGLLYGSQVELVGYLAWVAANPAKASVLASGGADYVKSHYQWPHVLDAIESTLEDWTVLS